MNKQLSVQNINYESRFKNIPLTNDNSSTNFTLGTAKNHSEEQFKNRLSS